MAGISSKAAGGIENKKKYNGIEFDNDFDINTYEAYFRYLDVQTGRWWQIDPKMEYEQESLSPYASMANDPILKSDPLGDVPGEGDGEGDKSSTVETVKTVVTAVVTILTDLFSTTANDLLTTTAAVVTGVANTVTLGLYPARPVLSGMTGRQMELFNNGVTVGQYGTIFLPGPKRNPTSGNEPAIAPANNKPNVNQAPKPPQQVKVIPSNITQIKGERNRTGNASGTNNPFKKFKPDPNKAGNVITKDQNGKTVSKKAPEGFWNFWNKKHGTTL
jgi:RHS repeat-associated protein